VYPAMDLCGGTPAPPRAHTHVRRDVHLYLWDGTRVNVGMVPQGDWGGLRVTPGRVCTRLPHCPIDCYHVEE